MLYIVNAIYIILHMGLQTTIELCPRVEAAFALLARKWLGLVVYALKDGESFFCELEKALPGLSARVLTQRLRELEGEGLVIRKVSPTSPPRVSYRLSSRGQALAASIASIADWARE
jgi:DNA-binding HxlR family transcriptional regulator